MNRIDRLSAILIQLQSKRVVKALDIAERFDISLRTVYRDVKALEEAGIPIIGEAGVGYSIMEGYRLPPVMFTREEALAFLSAEKLVDKLTDASNSAIYRSAMYKIKAVLKTTEKDLLEHIDQHIEVLQSRKRRLSDQPDMNLFQTILQGISENRVLCIRYFAFYTQQSTIRSIEPVGVFYLENYWHLVAFCKLRNDYRDFRFDRIQSLTVTEEKCSLQHPSIKEYVKRELENRNLHSVTIRIDAGKAIHMEEQKYYNGFISEIKNDSYVEMYFLTGSMEGFARWFITFADFATIVEPAILKARITELAEAIVVRLHH